MYHRGILLFSLHPMYVYSAVSPIVFSGMYWQVSGHRMALNVYLFISIYNLYRAVCVHHTTAYNIGQVPAPI